MKVQVHLNSIEVVRDTPYVPQVIQFKNNRETRLGHTELE